MAGPSGSYSETSSSSASLTQGGKSSGLTIAAPMSTPNFLNDLIANRSSGGDVQASSTLLALSAAALVVVVFLMRKGRK